MTTEAPPRLITAHDLLDLDAKGVYAELIRGELCQTMPPGGHHGKLTALLTAYLVTFVLEHSLGTVQTGDAGVWLERDPDTVRGPDIAYFSAETLPLDAEVIGYNEVIPDLVVEVKSPNDSRQAVHDKAHMWLHYGVRAVWVVLPESRSVDIYRPDVETVTVVEPNALSGGDILPGFRCQLDAIFGPPITEA